MKKDVLIYFSGKIIPALVNLAIIILAVRFLGEDQYGKYSLVFYASMLVSTLTFGWIQQSIIRFLSSYKNDPRPVLNRFFFLTVISTFIGVVILIILCLLYFHLGFTEIMMVVIYTIMYNFFMFHLVVNQAMMKSLKYAILEGSYNIIFLLFLLGFMYIFPVKNFIIIFISMVSGFIITELLRLFVLPDSRHGIDLKRICWDSGFTKKVMNYGFTLTLWLFLSYIINIADRYIIREYEDYAAVGTYSALKDLIIKISTFAIMPIMLAYNPKIMDAWNSNRRKESILLLRQAISFDLLLFFLIFIAFMVSRDFIYARVLNLKGEGLFFTSLLLVLSAFLWQTALFMHKPLELLLKQQYMIIAILICMVVNIALNFLLVPRYGYIAAALASFVSALLYVAIALILSFILLRKSQKP